MRSVLMLFLVLTFTGCESIFGVEGEVCHGSAGTPAVQVEITDAVTGEYLALQATGHVKKGAYTEEMYRSGGFIEERYLFADGNGPGEYDVFIEVEGYGTWSHQNAVATRDECGAILGATVYARLHPEG